MSISNCSQQCTWICNLFMEIGFPLQSPLPLFGDNQGSIFIAQSPVLDKQLKHINICFHYIQQEVQTKKVNVYLVKGSETLQTCSPRAWLELKSRNLEAILANNSHRANHYGFTLAHCIPQYLVRGSVDPYHNFYAVWFD
jgi:hypothetical protein